MPILKKLKMNIKNNNYLNNKMANNFKEKMKGKYIFPDNFVWKGRQYKYILICKEHNEKVEKIPNNFIYDF
jgi:hypothetical protein